MSQITPAPELITSQWFNCDGPQSLPMHLGKAVVVVAFQMLCPGCVSHSLPQAQRVHDMFPEDKVSVLGLHTVFEHHDAMTPIALKAFLHEYRVRFAVGVDAASPSHDMPQTMAAYGMRGTPTLLLIAPDGSLAEHHFGQVPDMRLGAEITALIDHKTVPLNDNLSDYGERDGDGADIECSGGARAPSD